MVIEKNRHSLYDGHPLFAAVNERGGSEGGSIVGFPDAAVADRGAGQGSDRSNDFGLAIFAAIQFLTRVMRTIAAAVANHYEGLATFEDRLGSIFG